MITAGKFPKQIQLGTRSVGWDEKSVESWLKDRISASQSADSKAHCRGVSMRWFKHFVDNNRSQEMLQIKRELGMGGIGSSGALSRLVLNQWKRHAMKDSQKIIATLASTRVILQTF
jgi:hypothetical protein